MLNCRRDVAVQDESLKKRMEIELGKVVERYNTKIRPELGCYLESAAIFLPVAVGRAAQQRTHGMAGVGDLFQQLVSAGKL